MIDRNLFAVLLRHWRNARGLSQNDLAAAADISSRHLSFLETSRARPSREMVLRLAAALDVPMREQNALLSGAGFSRAFVETGLGDELDPLVRKALDRMCAQQEPYPLMVMDRHYAIMLTNRAAQRMMTLMLGDVAPMAQLNLLKLAFDPQGFRPRMLNWETAARHLLLQLQRRLLQRPADEGLKQLFSVLCSYPGVPADWRTPDLSAPTDATLNVHFEHAGQRLSFLTAVTVFNAPQNITLEELCIESYFPLDDATELFCRELAK